MFGDIHVCLIITHASRVAYILSLLNRKPKISTFAWLIPTDGYLYHCRHIRRKITNIYFPRAQSTKTVIMSSQIASGHEFTTYDYS